MSDLLEILGLRSLKDTEFLTSTRRRLEKPKGEWGEFPVEVAVAHILLDHPETITLGRKALQTRSEKPIGEQLVERIAQRPGSIGFDQPGPVSDQALLVYLARQNGQFIDPANITDGTRLTQEVAERLDRALTHIGLSVLDYIREERLRGRLR